MSANHSTLFQTHPTQSAGAGTVLLRRSAASEAAIFIESGRVALGILGAVQPVAGTPNSSGISPPSPLEHQLGVVVGPAWLEANAAVLKLPNAVDAVAETDVVLRRIPIGEFRQSLTGGSVAVQAVLEDVARAHRQQTELAVSRLSKDAEARCAEWLLSQAQSSELGVCSVQLQQRKRLIAAQLGIAPETLSRVLRHLRERSLISGSGRTVNLVDPSGLRSLAGV
jgi:CRP-like cAMP-binding protein